MFSLQLHSICILIALIISTRPSRLIDQSSFLVRYISQEKFDQGMMYLQSNQYNNALQEFTSSYLTYQDNRVIDYCFYCLNQLNRNTLSWLESMLIKLPYDYYIHLHLGIQYHREGRFLEAINRYQILINNLKIENDEVYFNLAVSYQYAGYIDLSVQAYDKCLVYNTMNIRCRLNLASIYQYHGDLNLAVANYHLLLTQMTSPLHSPPLQLLSFSSKETVALALSNLQLPDAQATYYLHKGSDEYHMIKLNLCLSYLKLGSIAKVSLTICMHIVYMCCCIDHCQRFIYVLIF